MVNAAGNDEFFRVVADSGHYLPPLLSGVNEGFASTMDAGDCVYTIAKVLPVFVPPAATCKYAIKNNRLPVFGQRMTQIWLGHDCTILQHFGTD
jgi:hypothetical protein